MPAWKQAWQALCRYFDHDDARLAAAPGTERGGQLVARAIHQRWCRLRVAAAALLQAARRTPEQAAEEAIRHRRRAKRKAYSLLLNLLNPEQRQEFEAHGYFHLTGGATGDHYRIRVNSIVNIDVLLPDGTIKHHLCARPAGDIPMYDVMAGQLLYLQDPLAETRFLDQANKHPTPPYLIFPPEQFEPTGRFGPRSDVQAPRARQRPREHLR